MATPQLLHLRSTVQGKLPAAGSIQVGQIGVNYNAADPFLCIKDSANVVRRLGGTSTSATAPTAPQNGQLWVDITTPTAPVLKVWDGTTWVVATGGTKASAVQPTTAAAGDLWVDTSGTAPVLKVYNGTTWNPVHTAPASASDSAAGIVQLAAAADLTSGASDRVVTAAQLKSAVTAAGAYTLPNASAAVLGGVKVGSNLSIAADGTLSANITGAITYAGTLDATAAPPATPVTDGLYVSSATGTTNAGFTGAASVAVSAGDWLLYDGTKWDLVHVSAAAPDATTTVKGLVQLADAGAITAGTAGRVVDAAQLKVVNDAIATATGGGITGITGTAPITATGSGATRTISIAAATASAAGSMSSADKTKLDGIAAGAQVNVKPDWNAAAGADAEVLNKPTIPAAYTLPAATTSVLGGIKVGTGLTVASDGTLKSSVTGALIFKGSKDPTAAAPASPATGDVWVMNKAGTLAASWTGAAGQIVQLHEVIAWDGAEWTVMGSTGGTGVSTVTATAPLHATGTSAVALTVDAASATAAGVVQLATDAEATAGTATNRAVTPAQLKANVPTVAAATTTKAGIVQLADGVAVTAGTAGLTAGTAGLVVDAAQLKAVSDADDWTRTGTTLSPKTAGDVVTVSAGTAAAPGLAVVGDPDTGIYSPGADQLAVSTGGTERARIDSSGNVGIGTSAPSEKLSVFGGNIEIDEQVAGRRIGFTVSSNFTPPGGNVTADYGLTFQPTSKAYSVGLAGFGGLNFYTNRVERLRIDDGGSTVLTSFAATAPFIANIGATEVVRIDSSGRLLVGSSAARAIGGGLQANTGSQLFIEGGAGDLALSTFVLNRNDTNPASIVIGKSRGTAAGGSTVLQNKDFVGRIVFAGADGTDVDTPAAFIEAAVDGTPGADVMPGRLGFSTTAAGAASPTERLGISSTGAVTINNLAGTGVSSVGVDASGNLTRHNVSLLPLLP